MILVWVDSIDSNGVGLELLQEGHVSLARIGICEGIVVVIANVTSSSIAGDLF